VPVRKPRCRPAQPGRAGVDRYNKLNKLIELIERQRAYKMAEVTGLDSRRGSNGPATLYF
jgi:hypothetical protein